jgi:hypothetical protein
MKVRIFVQIVLIPSPAVSVCPRNVVVYVIVILLSIVVNYRRMHICFPKIVTALRFPVSLTNTNITPSYRTAQNSRL